MNAFEFYCPTKIEFGVNVADKVNEYLKALKITKPVVVTDKIIMGVPAVSKIINGIENSAIFDTVLPNPTSELVMELKKFVEENHGDGMVVFGGGSSIDSAKGASIVAYTNTQVSQYYDFAKDQRPIEKTLPIIAVPTTSGTGSEVSKYAVITDSESNLKECLTSDLITPRIALVDPALAAGMPPKVTVSTGLDALSHALESLESKIENPLTNVLALHAIELVFNNLNTARLDGSNMEARSNMAFAALIAGIAMSHCCGTIGHAMGCQVTTEYGIPHGLAVSVFQKNALDYVGEKVANIKMLVDFLDKTDYPKKIAVPVLKAKLDDLFASLGMEMTLKESHITMEGIHNMIDGAMKHGCMGLNPVPMKEEQIVELYKNIM